MDVQAYLSEQACRRLGRIVERISALSGRDPGRVDDMVEMATQSLAYSGDKARRDLDWRPRSLDHGLRETAVATVARRRTKKGPNRSSRVHVPKSD